MSDFVVAKFIVNGVKQTGLDPKIDIWKVEDDSQVVTNLSMPEIGTTGIYKFLITAALDNDNNYTGFVDGGVTLPTTERFKEFSFSLRLDNRIEDVHDEALGEWKIDIGAKTLTLKRKGGATLKVFDLTEPVSPVPSYIERIPQ
jgi:hypothetical protein